MSEEKLDYPKIGVKTTGQANGDKKAGKVETLCPVKLSWAGAYYENVREATNSCWRYLSVR